MLAHCFIHFGVWPLLTDEVLSAIRLLTRSATPTFIILFGMMLEIVYLKMIRRGDRKACWTRLITRAIQCYLLYLCVVAAGIVGGHLSPTEGAKAALFLSQAYFANILKFYSLGLVAGILLVELRARFGLGAVAAALLVIWLSYPLIQALPAFPHSVRHLASFLIGAGAETGPSVLQGMSLAALGMFLGNAAGGLWSDETQQRRRSRRLLGAINFLVAAAVAALLLSLGLGPTLDGFIDFSFRAANHPGYYILGSAVAMTLIACCTLAAAAMPRHALARVNVFGTSSLFAYAFGNVVLNLLPMHSGSLGLGLAYSAAFLLGLYGATAYFQLTLQAQAPGEPHRPMAARLGRLHNSLGGWTMRFAALFIDRLLPKSPSR